LLKKVFADEQLPSYIVNYGNRCAVFQLASPEIPKEMKIAGDMERQRLKDRLTVVERYKDCYGVPYQCTLPNVKWDSVADHMAYAKKHNDQRTITWLKENAFQPYYVGTTIPVTKWQS
jgi:hypothetical protein